MHPLRAHALVLPAFLAFLLLASAVQAPGPPPGFGRDWYDRALDLADQYGMFGGFETDGDRVVGSFVEVTVNPNTLGLVDYTVKKPFGGVTVFARVDVGAGASGTLAVDGSVFTLTSGEISLRVHNNPLAVLLHESHTGTQTVTYTLGPDIVAADEGNLVLVAGGGLRGGIVTLGGTVDVAGNTVVATLPADASAVFRAHLAEGEGVAGSAEQDVLLDGLAAGVLVAEDFDVPLQGGVAQDTVAYEAVTVSAAVVEGGVRIQVDASFSTGRSLAFHLHRDLFGSGLGTELSVDLDGRPVPRAGSAVAALHGVAAKYHATVTDEGVLVIVFVPSFSTHTILVRGPDALPLSPLGTLGVVAAVGAVGAIAAAAFAAVRRERRKW